MLAAGLTVLGALAFLLVIAIGYYRDALQAERWRGDRPSPGAHRASRLGDRACRVVLTRDGAIVWIERSDSGWTAGDLARCLEGGSECAI